MDPVAPAVSTGLSNLATQGILGTLVVLLMAVVVYQYVTSQKLAQQIVDKVAECSKEKVDLLNQRLKLEEDFRKQLLAVSDDNLKRILLWQDSHAVQLRDIHVKHGDEVRQLNEQRVEDAQGLSKMAEKMLADGRGMADLLSRAFDQALPKKPRS